jgi:hypothetical protein
MATAPATSALVTVDDAYVPTFSGDAIGSYVELAMPHDPAADARADGEPQYHGPVSPCAIERLT